MTFDLTVFLISVLALVAASASLAIQWSGCTTSNLLMHQDDHQKIRYLEAHLQMFSRLIEQSLAVRLHAPTHHELDALLHKLAENTISTDEARLLHRLILERSTELKLQGDWAPDLNFPRMMTLWSLEVRLLHQGQTIVTPAAGHEGL